MAYLNGQKKNNAQYLNREYAQLYKNAGINPCTGTPLKRDAYGLKQKIKELLEVNDRQCAIQSGTWYNAPPGLDGELIERILYFRGKGVFFYMPTDGKFYFLPCTLGPRGIDIYGRYIDAVPMSFNGAADNGEDSPFILGMTVELQHDISMQPDLTKGVLLQDFSIGISQTNPTRAALNEPIIDLEADLLPFARTNLLIGTGVRGMRVGGDDEESNVYAANEQLKKAALEGDQNIPIYGSLDFQELSMAPLTNVQDYLLTMQSIDNFRLSQHGVDSGGIFQKQAHMLQSENLMNQSKSSLVLADKTYQRQHFCDIVNSLTGLGMWWEPSEAAIDLDRDMDGDYSGDSSSSFAARQEGGRNDTQQEL